jgi:hypothetical protein
MKIAITPFGAGEGVGGGGGGVRVFGANGREYGKALLNIFKYNFWPLLCLCRLFCFF